MFLQSHHIKSEPQRDRGLFADPGKKSLLLIPGLKVVPLTESIGTVLENVQLSALTPRQLDELALLVKLFEHYGELDRHPSQKDTRHHVIRGSTIDHREILAYTPWPSGVFHADTSFEINPPSYSMLRMEEHPPVGGDTAWVSWYGLYDTLSDAMKNFLSGLHAIHTSRLQYDTILDLWQVPPDRAPVDTHHPTVRTHPVTSLKALNVNLGFVTGFAELRKYEGDKILDFLNYHIHAADDHYVRFKWEVGSVALWDSRAVVHRVIPGSYEAPRRGIRTTVFGEKPYFDPKSEGRLERQKRLQAEKANGNEVHGGSGNGVSN
ncbi:putative alpha-ketoglutarate-dependent sulfonate dioxygenase [Triangularia verruculosa]|uniref:Alpha-ketoglutarate-dependent sulfonate dioxygenase n=1 Tax=Triangularia verruculosa TaxID=2587418 RepID=A0AAN7AVJ7_9PEZI|nr:putative alpha-ketoglutarate-dependent sulfonate dioxygenase [Triangularia verruculosa]